MKLLHLIQILCSILLVVANRDPKLHGIFLDEKPTPRIVGGIESIKGRYPYQVALVANDFQFCAGTLIAPEWILSAAHCYGYATHILIGRHDLGNATEVYDKIEVDHEIKHPKYNSKTFNYDFMLIKLLEIVPPHYFPITLDDGSMRLSKSLDLTVMGWGTKGTGLEASEVLLEVEVDYFSRRECKNRYAVEGEKIMGAMICAARYGKDSCQGDSGGPLIKRGQNSTEDIQVGIVSWGFDCADCRFPGVYARVSKAIDFIDSYVSR